MDDVDRAQERESADRALAIAAARKASITATGECHNCGESLPSGLLFCDSDCRDDYEKTTAARRRNGFVQ